MALSFTDIEDQRGGKPKPKINKKLYFRLRKSKPKYSPQSSLRLNKEKRVFYYFAPFEESEKRDCLFIHSTAYRLI